MTTDRTALASLPAAPESRLADGLLERLPAGTPPPPWSCRVESVLWWHRAGPAALAVLPAELRHRALSPLVVGALVRYLDSPVGPYSEVIGGVLYRPLTVHIPLIAVDSLPSVHGGRAHWALPKAYAGFQQAADAPTGVHGDGWALTARPRPVGPRLPLAGLLLGRQYDAAGRAVASTSGAYGTGRACRVAVDVTTALAGEPGSIAGWLLAGNHRGLVLRGRLRVGGGGRSAGQIHEHA